MRCSYSLLWPTKKVFGTFACGRNREWDLPVEGTFDVMVVRVEPTTCPVPEGITLTVREMKGTQTVGDEWADYMATFTQAGKTAVRFCGTKTCEDHGGVWFPWRFLEEDDCVASRLDLDICNADKGAIVETNHPLGFGYIWEWTAKTANRGTMEGRMKAFGWYWDPVTQSTCSRSDVEFYLTRQ